MFRVLALLPLPVLHAVGMEALIRERPARYPWSYPRDKKPRQVARA